MHLGYHSKNAFISSKKKKMQNRNVHVHYSRGQVDMVFFIGILMNFTTLGKKKYKSSQKSAVVPGTVEEIR